MFQLIFSRFLSESFCCMHDSNLKPDEQPALLSLHWNFSDKFRASGEYKTNT